MPAIQCSVVVPVYNEELVIAESYRRLKAVMEQSGGAYEILFVNDGSADKTEEMLRVLCRQDQTVKMLSFSRNFGHQTAITAGMDHASGACVVVIDADLQDPPELILDMLQKWREGWHVVYGKRLQRKGETAFKKVTAKLFYRLLSAMTDVAIPVDTGDFRLLDRQVLTALSSLPERNRYVRGLVSWVGFRQTAVEYVREERFAGETKYPLRKMLKFAGDALTSFSYKPLKLSIYLGSILSFLSFVFLLVILIARIFWAGTAGWASGWASLITVVLFFNGVVLIMLGIMGQYVGRIYDEAKARPLYIIGEKVGFDQE